MLYEVRGSDQGRMYTAVLKVLDSEGVRLQIIDRDSFAGLQRMTFAVTCNLKKHARLLAELRATDQTDEVVVFRDVEEE